MGFAEGVPTVEIQLGGKSYTLGWTWAARRRSREYLIAQGKENTASQYENVAAALWAGMEERVRAEISVGAIEEMIHPGNESEILEKMSALFEKSEPDPDPNAKPSAAKIPTEGKQTSMSSGRSAGSISGLQAMSSGG